MIVGKIEWIADVILGGMTFLVRQLVAAHPISSSFGRLNQNRAAKGNPYGDGN